MGQAKRRGLVVMYFIGKIDITTRIAYELTKQLGETHFNIGDYQHKSTNSIK